MTNNCRKGNSFAKSVQNPDITEYCFGCKGNCIKIIIPQTVFDKDEEEEEENEPMTELVGQIEAQQPIDKVWKYIGRDLGTINRD